MLTTEHDLMWQQIVGPLERNGMALQVQIRTAIVTAILDGRLLSGTRLPSGRELAILLGVSRNTTVLVYERLVSDGYLCARNRNGYFVSDALAPGTPPSAQASADMPHVAHTAHAASDRIDWQRRTSSIADPSRWLDRPARWHETRYPFVYGQFDQRLFPLAEWRECVRQTLDTNAVHEWAHDGTREDSSPLIDQLVRRVLPRRGIAALPAEVLVTMGTQHGLYLLATLFGNQPVIGMEDPGYMDVRNIFRLNRARVIPLPMDEHGITLSPALAHAQYVYCTPSHQCPTGVTMPTDRRLALLAHAVKHDQVIFEDDYDPETQYVGEPSPALKAIDRTDRVIYLSSLSKLLAPGLRIGYIVAPEPVIARLRILRRLMIRHAPGNNQLAAALFIRQGHYDRLLKETRSALAERAGLLVEALRRHLPDLDFTPPQGGASLWLKLPEEVDLHALEAHCLAKSVLYDPGAPFYADADPDQPNPANRSGPFIRLGFSAIAPDRIDAGIREFARALNASRMQRAGTASARLSA